MTWLDYLRENSRTPRWVVGLLLFLTFCRPAPQAEQRLDHPRDVKVILHYLNTNQACPTEQVKIGVRSQIPSFNLSLAEAETRTVTIPNVSLREKIQFSFDCADEVRAQKSDPDFKWHTVSYPVPVDRDMPLEVWYKRSPESVEYALGPFYQQ
ncbi:hypothetical protein GCM10017783_21410 [Deinococcus piscis]|uniref:Lipoprotein n=1 Tax=Deinococcus piscis TaxID=394230 RepID=A0ABQ3K9U0_9DEIO|nr:hypothetical protein [Deinococcus piscis]GHG08587.1 hypothetical protein GCM10017783_21410 [Deinococcus piscis]